MNRKMAEQQVSQFKSLFPALFGDQRAVIFFHAVHCTRLWNTIENRIRQISWLHISTDSKAYIGVFLGVRLFE